MKNFNYKAIRALWTLGAMLPFKVLYLLSDVIYFLIYYVAGYRRKVVRDNLTKSFPEKSLKEIVAIEKKFYAAFCDYIVETIKLIRIKPEKMKKYIRFEGIEEVERMHVEDGKPAVVYIGHFFNWEYITSLPLHLKNSDINLGQIYHPLSNVALDRLFIELREQFGSECIAMKNTLRRILDLNRSKKPYIVGFIADQVPHWEAISLWLPFFHRETPVFVGTEKIARKIDGTVYYMSFRKERRGRYVATFHLISNDVMSLPEDELTKKYYALLEDNIRECPELWLWTHRRWKRTRARYQEWNERRLKRLKEKSQAQA